MIISGLSIWELIRDLPPTTCFVLLVLIFCWVLVRCFEKQNKVGGREGRVSGRTLQGEEYDQNVVKFKFKYCFNNKNVNLIITKVKRKKLKVKLETPANQVSDVCSQKMFATLMSSYVLHGIIKP